MLPGLGDGGSGMRNGTSASRGVIVGSPQISIRLNASKSGTPISGHASAACVSYNSSRRGRSDVLAAEPCTSRTW